MELAGRTDGEYAYLDAGDGWRLERFGPYVFRRPAAVALWAPERPALWQQAAGVYQRGRSGTGSWTFHQRLPAAWPLRWAGYTFKIKPTGFGHLGLFPEHSCHWEWVVERIRSAGRPCRVLHLFAYTGALTLVAARAGAEVCHVDAVPDINAWARTNASESGLAEAPIRWITDDVDKFVARELRRGRRYEGVILDPPSYGKGPGGERWVIEKRIVGLLDQLLRLMAAAPRFLLFTCHTPGFSPTLLRNLLLAWPARFGGAVEAGTMILSAPGCQRVLPAGCFARWQA